MFKPHTRYISIYWPFEGGGSDVVLIFIVLLWQTTEHLLVSYGSVTTFDFKIQVLVFMSANEKKPKECLRLHHTCTQLMMGKRHTNFHYKDTRRWCRIVKDIKICFPFYDLRICKCIVCGEILDIAVTKVPDKLNILFHAKIISGKKKINCTTTLLLKTHSACSRTKKKLARESLIGAASYNPASPKSTTKRP